MTDGSMVGVTASLNQQRTAHFPFFVPSFRKKAKKSKRLMAHIKGEAPKELQDVAFASGVEGLGIALDATGLVVPGAGLLVNKTIQGGKAVKKRKAQKRLVNQGGGVAGGLSIRPQDRSTGV
jgi:hypothetical protein